MLSSLPQNFREGNSLFLYKNTLTNFIQEVIPVHSASMSYE